MTFPFLLRKEIKDEFSQENFTRIQDYFRALALDRCEFQFFEIVYAGAVTAASHPHQLNFVPKDVILLHNLANTTVTFLYSQFDRTNIYVTTGAATTLRFLLGRYS